MKPAAMVALSLEFLCASVVGGGLVELLRCQLEA
jgi:hypothetical protein